MDSVPGKVPFKVLEQQYGASVQQEVLGTACSVHSPRLQ